MRGCIAGFFALFFVATAAKAENLELYIDADYSVSFAAAEAIELGVRTALAEAGDQLGGIPVTLVRKDHRGNVKRSYRTMQQFLQSPTALAMIGGLHSPPYITHREFMNENSVLTMLPWSAGAPITRAAAGDENWIFRVSIDDSKSGEFFVREAIERQGCSAIALVLLETGWGRAAEAAIKAALATRNMNPAIVEYFPFSVGDAAAGTLANAVASSSADCAILLANAGNGATVFRALHGKTPGLRIFSHWGIMGGAFHTEVPPEMRRSMDLRVLQTCALRAETDGSEVLAQALARAMPAAAGVAEIGAVTGFVHGYDMTRIMLAAADQAAETDAWKSGSITDRRRAMKDALEDLRVPVEGILKTYSTPFRAWSSGDRDAHEALGIDDLCMARFRDDGLLQDAN
jgi:branched-chain amino acid transport system substrate-binding protein